MRTFQFVFGAFATLNAVYGLPTTDASIESSLAKRDKHDLPYDFEVYKDCLHNDFKDSFSKVNPWGGVACSKNREIRFWAEQIIGWQSGEDCYKWGNEGLLNQIYDGDAQATKKLMSNGNLFNRCQIGVRTMPYPISDYVDCLDVKVKKSLYEDEKWDSVICDNEKIEFAIGHGNWNSPRDCFNAVADDVREQLYANYKDAQKTVRTGFFDLAQCTMRVKYR